MIDWLETGGDDAVLKTILTVMMYEDLGKRCLEKRSENPFDYMDFVSLILRRIGEKLQRCGSNRMVYKREKNNEMSAKLRKEGNDVFCSSYDLRGLEKVLQLYTQSIANAIPNTPALGMAYANRSAVLLKLKRPEESLEDIERALNSNYPEESKAKLFIRTADCYSMLATHSYIQAKFWLSKVLANDPNRKELQKQLREHSAKDYDKVIDEELILPKVASPSSKFPCASDALDVEYSGYAGRKIVATRDIEIGEVLVVEKPYLTYVHGESCYICCSHCLKSFFAGIPCDQCTQTLYCSTECKAVAWEKYHKFGCAVLDLLQQYNEFGDNSVMNSIACSKLFIQFYNEAGGLMALKETIKNFHQINDERLERAWCSHLTMERVLASKNYMEKLEPVERFMFPVFSAIRALFHLATATDLLGTQYKREWMPDEDIVVLMSKKLDILFAGGLLIKLSLILQFNQNLFADQVQQNLNHLYFRGTTMLPFTSLFTVACDYNIVGQCPGEYHSLHSVLPIKRGEEVVTCIGRSWRTVPKAERHAVLQKVFIECSRRPCEDNWPLHEQLESFEVRAKSAQWRAKLRQILKPLHSLHRKVTVGDIQNKDEVLSSLKKMMEAVCEGVNLPCKEYADLIHALTIFYGRTGSISKMRYLEAHEKYNSILENA